MSNFFKARLKHTGEKNLSMGGWWNDNNQQKNRKKT
jgi:hypothetical protein